MRRGKETGRGASPPRVPSLAGAAPGLKRLKVSTASTEEFRFKSEDSAEDGDGALGTASSGGSGQSSSTHARRPWSIGEDDLLRAAVAQYKGQQWKLIAQLVPGRTHVQCLQRWQKSLHPGLVKGRWKRSEDEALLDYVERNPVRKSWAEVALFMPGRTAKQCRERYNNYLNPSDLHSGWSRDEDETILAAYLAAGNRIAEVRSTLEGRSDNSVRTRLRVLTCRVPNQAEDETELRRSGADSCNASASAGADTGISACSGTITGSRAGASIRSSPASSSLSRTRAVLCSRQSSSISTSSADSGSSDMSVVPDSAPAERVFEHGDAHALLHFHQSVQVDAAAADGRQVEHHHEQQRKPRRALVHQHEQKQHQHVYDREVDMDRSTTSIDFDADVDSSGKHSFQQPTSQPPLQLQQQEERLLPVRPPYAKLEHCVQPALQHMHVSPASQQKQQMQQQHVHQQQMQHQQHMQQLQQQQMQQQQMQHQQHQQMQQHQQQQHLQQHQQHLQQHQHQQHQQHQHQQQQQQQHLQQQQQNQQHQAYAVTVKAEHDTPERELAYPHSPRTSAPVVQQTPASTVTSGNPFMSYHSAEARVPGRFAQAMQVATPPPVYLGMRVGAESIDYASVLKTPPMSPSLLSPASDPDLCTSILAATSSYSSYGSLPGYSQASQLQPPGLGGGGALAFGDEYDKAKMQGYWLPRQA